MYLKLYFLNVYDKSKLKFNPISEFCKYISIIQKYDASFTYLKQLTINHIET